MSNETAIPAVPVDDDHTDEHPPILYTSYLGANNWQISVGCYSVLIKGNGIFTVPDVTILNTEEILTGPYI